MDKRQSQEVQSLEMPGKPPGGEEGGERGTESCWVNVNMTPRFLSRLKQTCQLRGGRRSHGRETLREAWAARSLWAEGLPAGCVTLGGCRCPAKAGW